MFDLPSEKKRKDSIGIIAEQKKDVRLLGNMRKPKGMNLYEYDVDFDTVKKVEFKASTVRLNDFTDRDMQNIVIHHKVVFNPRCIYVLAINEQNAKKKALKRLSQTKLF